MTHTTSQQNAAALRAALETPDASHRLQAALSAGTRPDPAFIDVLVERCAVEPDFFVRDMLTWALVRQDRAPTLEALLPQLASDVAQARSQALHTLSKIADPAIGGAITPALISDPDDEVAAAAWRTAAALVPPGREAALAAALAAELGRGDRETQRRLSRAFAALGAPARAAVENGALSQNEAVSAHALATLAVMDNPDESFESAVHEATRIVALRAAPSTE
jgi:hypothetical protein